jgi:predicted PurR-regulated permease PerM
MSLPPPSEKQARLIWLALTGLSIAVLAALAAGLIWGLGRVLQILSPVLWPLAVAGVMAYLLDPVVDFIERKGAPRSRAIVYVFAVALLCIALLFCSVVPQLVAETRQLASRVPEYGARLEQRINDWVSHPPRLVLKLLERGGAGGPAAPPASATNTIMRSAATNSPGPAGSSTNAPSLLDRSLDNEHLETAAGWLAAALKKGGSWLLGQFLTGFGLLAGLALVPVYTFYFLLEKRGISSRWTDYLPVSDSRFKSELVFVLNAVNNYLIAFFRGQVLVALCDGILYGMGFLIIGLPYALLIGVMAVFLTMIPYLGAFLTCATALIIALVQFGDWRHPLLVLAVFGVVQTLEGLVISPKIMGNRVGLHPVTIIIAVMVGTTLLGGLLGGILAIPLTAALRVLMFRYVWKRDSQA